VAVIDLEEDKNSGNDINKANYGQECDAEKSKFGIDDYKDDDDSKGAKVGDMVEE
jgi:hypothetical protein